MNIYPLNFNTSIYQRKNTNNHFGYSSLAPLKSDCVSFTGKSAPSAYKDIFQYISSEILSSAKKYKVDGSGLSASKISQTVDDLYAKGLMYRPFDLSDASKVKWKPYVALDVREGSVVGINKARMERMNSWKEFLESPASMVESSDYPELISELRENKSLRFVVWHSIISDLKPNNRHIPVPLDLEVLDETVKGFKKLEKNDWSVRALSPSFLDIYTNKLRDNLLKDKFGVTTEKSVWIKIPSLKHSGPHNTKGIGQLEILSNRNWCTRSSVDKAEAALQEGDFYIYLTKDSQRLWNPVIAFATKENKIDQIQGVENNNLIPLAQLKNIKNYIAKQGLRCRSGISDEGPKAMQQILIAEKLSEISPTGKKFVDVLNEGDNKIIHTMLGRSVTKNFSSEANKHMISISTYKPYMVENDGKIVLPYSMMNINEDNILNNVTSINGDFIIGNKNPLLCSNISEFPKKLNEVTDKLVCTKEQFEKFKDDILRVVGGCTSRVRIV